VSASIATVTGGGSGIGAAIATTLGQRGFHVIVTDLDLASATKTAQGIGSAQAMQLDVTDPVACEVLVQAIVAEHGRLDVWISNAGISKMQRFVDISPEDLARNFEVNTYGAFFCGQSAARAMIKLGKPACIVNTASMAAKEGGVSFLSDYVASKFAVLGLTQAMAAELAPYAIRVNCVCPGYVATPMQSRELAWEAELRGVDEEAVMASYLSNTPLGRLETAADVAKVVAFLVSDDAAFITGEAISINGGAYMD
jgi:meso-butanediol dehydrogenase/(S,S)-butanediol dehydrogenase/diacetyl reductase